MFIILLFSFQIFKDFLNNYKNKSLNIPILLTSLKINLPIKEFHVISVAFFILFSTKLFAGGRLRVLKYQVTS